MLLSMGCDSSDSRADAAQDATHDMDAGLEDAGPRCSQFVDGGILGPVLDATDAGGGDAGVDWYQSEACLTSDDDCSIISGSIGDQVCVRVGLSGGLGGTPDSWVEVNGGCIVLRDVASGETWPDDCGFDCFHWLYHLYELTDEGRCTLEARRDGDEPFRAYFDIAFSVVAP
jgi:hypothetical protein